MVFIAPIERPPHDCRPRFAITNFHCACLARGWRIFRSLDAQICHRDRPLNRGRERPAGHDARLFAVSKYAVTLPRDHPTVVGLQADECLLESAIALSCKRLLADERTPQLHEDSEAGLQRRRIAIE